MSTLRGRRKRPSSRPRARVSALAARLASDREHYAALMADAAPDLAELSMFLDSANNRASLDNPEWAAALVMTAGEG